MDRKIYEKTRYQCIYRHKKNKNYVIFISKPVKTSISKIDGKKITDIDEAKKVRDDIQIKQQKALETLHKDNFDILWEKYIGYCECVLKLDFSTIDKKKQEYNKHLKEQIDLPLAKTNREYWAKFIDNLNCTDKQKNEIMKNLNAFFNWCVDNKHLLSNPLKGVKRYKIPKTEMKYWTPDEFKRFLDCVNNDISNENLNVKRKAFLIKILILTGFILGDRIGETRALTFGCFDKQRGVVTIKHSINYDTESKDYLKSTKNYQSQREIDISDKYIQEIENYRNFLINELKIEISNNTIIIFNHKSNRPYSDTILRRHFYEYCNKAGVKQIRLYDLRHTYVATMMMEGKELYHISERIGHSNYSTTVNKYGHLSTQVRKEVAKTTDKYF